MNSCGVKGREGAETGRGDKGNRNIIGENLGYFQGDAGGDSFTVLWRAV